MLREALSNAARHAKASSVDVSLTVGDEVVLTVTDDGVGIPEGVRHERAAQHGRARGVCRRPVRARARPGGGTTVRWSVPVERP